MNKRSQRGAARVSAVWLIVSFVLTAVAIAVIFVAYEDAAAATQSRDEAQQTADQAIEDLDVARQLSVDISKRLGFYDPNVVGATSALDAAETGLTQLKSTFPDMGDDVADYEKTIPILVSAYSARLREIETLSSRITDLQGQLTQANQAANRIAETKDSEIQTLQQQLADAQNTAADQKSQDEARIDNLTQSRNQVDSELRTARGEIDDLNREAELAAQAATTRAANLTQMLAFLKQPEASDGKVLDFSKALDLGWIDRGAKDRITRGMRFRVDSGNAAAPRIKGEVQVIGVKENMSEVRVVSLADPFDPIVSGDVISNPLYDPEGIRHAVLVGRFSGTWNERELEILLKDIGIEVQDKVDLTTTHLIVGNEMYVDEEGEPVEEPIQPSETSTYKDAIELGVNVVSINDVQHFFKK